MEGKTWMRMPMAKSQLGDLISWEITANKSDSLNFSKWFTYNNQDLDNVHSSAEEIKTLNDEKVSNFLWQSIPTKEMTDKEIEDFTKWLSNQQLSWINKNQDKFSTNAMVEYINNWDTWKNPFAEWTWMFEAKNSSILGWNWYEKLGKWTLIWVWWELWWRWLENLWKWIYNWATPNAKDDADKIVNNKTAKRIMTSIDSEISRIWWEIERLKANGWSEEEIAKLERAYNQLLKQKESRTTGKQQLTRDLAREKWYVGSDLNIASQAKIDKDELWITDIEEKMAMSNAKFKKSDILSSLTREDFWVSEAAWEKEYKPVIDEYIKFYSDKWDDTLLTLQEWKNEIWKTFEYNERWEKISSTKNNIKSRVQDKISEVQKTQLEKEYPWQWMSEKINEYGKLKTVEDEFKTRWGNKISKEKTLPKTQLEIVSKVERWTKWWQRKVGKFIENIWKFRPTKIVGKLLDLVGKNKKLAAIIWIWAAVFNNPVVKAWLVWLDIAWDVEIANESKKLVDEYRKFAPVVQRIHARFDDEDTRIWWEFAWMSEEEKEKKYPISDVLKDIQWLDDNWYEDFLTTYMQYEMPDFLWWKSIKIADFDELWDYVWWRLKNEEDEDSFAEKWKRERNLTK